MRQVGTVIELNGNTAKVECDRQSACSMCENAESCVEKCKKVYATADNLVKATVGDTVEIQTDTGMVLLNAFIVFVLPVFLSVVCYFGVRVFFREIISIIVTFAVLVFSLVLFSSLLNRISKKRTVSKIVKIL